MVETSDEWIVTRTGIRERRIAAAHETVATMGFEAAKQALAMAGVSAEQIGLIIVATTSGTHAFPSSACQIQSMLGVKGCPAFDVAAACAGFTYALSVADQYVKNGAVDYALVVGADVLARTCDPADRGTIIIFGDGAGAVVLGASEEPGIISTHLHADGSYGELLTLPNADRVDPENPIYLTMAATKSSKWRSPSWRTSLMRRWQRIILNVQRWTGWCRIRLTCVLSARRRRNWVCRWITSL